MKKTLFFFALLLISFNAHATNYQDVWYDTSKGGEGVTISQQGTSLFVAFYSYASNGAATWLLGQGTLSGTTMSAALYAYTGTPLTQTYNPGNLASQQIGSMTLNFLSPTSASMAITAYGTNSTLNLVRYNFGSFIPDGAYVGQVIETRTACTYSSNNGTFSGGENFTITTSGSQFTMYTQDAGGTCTYNGTWAQQGSKATASGSFSCSTGDGGTWTANDVTVSDYAVVVLGTEQFTAGETCSVQLRVGGAK